MKLLPTQTDEASLLQIGREAVSLFEKRDFQSLADRFSYALALGKSPAAAIEEDFQTCIADFRASPEPRLPVRPSMVVRYFKPNNSNLFAVVECFFSASEGCPILAEFIVTSLREDTHVTLEDVSLAMEPGD